MRRLGNTVARLSAMKLARQLPLAAPGEHAPRPLAKFGSNPGALDALRPCPDDLAPGAALVVVLHGCTQNAAGYDRGSGWSSLPTATASPCSIPSRPARTITTSASTGISPADARRGQARRCRSARWSRAWSSRTTSTRARIFVTGLSAGGAMTSVMLATYPDVFAGGAMIAGLPFATANNVARGVRPHARPRRAAQATSSADAGRQGLAIIADRGRPCRCGTARSDITVDPVNADDIVDQWRALHGVDGAAGEAETVDGYRREQLARRRRDAS